METSSLENVPELIECSRQIYYSGSWPNILGAKFDGTVDRRFPAGCKKYRYTFNNLWNKKVTFCLELIGREFEYLESFAIVKITPK
jgi:hypothetical protein